MSIMKVCLSVKACALAFWLLLVGGDLNADQAPIKVEVRGQQGDYQLYRDGLPYEVRGAGVAVHTADAESMMRQLKLHGGNSLRTWNVGDGEFLDIAHKLGLTVALCLNVARERHGFDYDDEVAVKRQLERLEQQVIRHRNHPALLAWIIGNELNHELTNPRVYDAVNDISKMIHALDPNHPTTSTTTFVDKKLARTIAERAPDLDFLSVQVYGAIFALDDILRNIGKDVPVMVTEWGPLGHWEVPTTRWGAPIEPDSRRKAITYLRGHEEMLKPFKGRLIGNYTFLWGQKQERTPTWYGLFVNGKRTEAVDVLHKIWTGAEPPNRAPLIVSLTIAGKTAEENIRLAAGRTYQAKVAALDPESGALGVAWQIMEESDATESGGDIEEVPTDYSRFLGERTSSGVTLQAPDEPGAYRLFVYIYDDAEAVAYANLPFLVR